MKVATPLFTAEDLWNLAPDGQRQELVKGELRTMPPAGFEHGAIGFDLGLALGNHVKEHGLGRVVTSDTGFLLCENPDTVRAADVAFVSQKQIDDKGVPKKYFPGAPDLVVEVLSPSDTVYAVDEKVEEWLAGGARMVWVLNPRKRTVAVYVPRMTPKELAGDDVLDGGEVVPGFQRPVADLFRQP